MYIVLMVILLAYGVVNRSDQIILISLSMILLMIILRGYVELSTAVLTRSEVSVERSGHTENHDIKIVFKIRNNSYLPILSGELFIEHSPHLNRISVGRALIFIPAKSVVQYSVIFRGRVGVHRIGPLKIVVRDPLGLFKSQEIILHRSFYIKIYPEIQHVIMRRIYSYARGIGFARSREAGEGIEFRSVRDYRPGDDMRRIVWKIFARRGRLAVKEMERESSIKILYIIVASQDFFRGVYLYTPYEQISRIIGSVARYVARRSDYQSIIFVSPSGVYHTENFLRGYNSFIEILRKISSANYEKIFDEEKTVESYNSIIKDLLLKKFSREKLLIFLFTDPATASEQYFEELINRLKILGHKIVVMMPLRSLYDIKALSDLSALIYKIKIMRETEREEEILKKLRSRGIEGIALTPEQMIIHIIEKIEMFRY